MRVDRHHDPTMELESRLLSELDFIAQQLRGKITQSMYANSCLLYTSDAADE